MCVGYGVCVVLCVCYKCRCVGSVLLCVYCVRVVVFNFFACLCVCSVREGGRGLSIYPEHML